MARQQKTIHNINLQNFNPKKAKKFKHLLQLEFKQTFITLMQMNFFARFKAAKIILFKNYKALRLDPKLNATNKELKK